MRLHTIRQGRPGFTLIEMLVVMGLIILLAGIALTISYSGLIDNYKTVGAGDRASGWLLISKSRATREGAPRGVRFFFDPSTNLCKEAQYIEVPDPYVVRKSGTDPARIVLNDNGMGSRTVTIVGVNTTDLQANVETGDTLSIPEYGVLVQVGSPAFSGVTATQATVSVNGSFLPNMGTTTATSTTFGFIRKARPMIGEPILQLTEGNAIDGKLCSPAVPVGTTYIDVLFASNGEVLNTSNGKTIFFIRNPTINPGLALNSNRGQFEAAGSMNLVTIYSKTGAIATHPVKLPQGAATATFVPGEGPFDFTKDGFNTGL